VVEQKCLIVTLYIANLVTFMEALLQNLCKGFLRGKINTFHILIKLVAVAEIVYTG
jgi:hypothetical protein